MQQEPQEKILKPLEAKKKGKKKELTQQKPILKHLTEHVTICEHKDYESEVILIGVKLLAFIIVIQAIKTLIITPVLARFFSHE